MNDPKCFLYSGILTALMLSSVHYVHKYGVPACSRHCVRPCSAVVNKMKYPSPSKVCISEGKLKRKQVNNNPMDEDT